MPIKPHHRSNSEKNPIDGALPEFRAALTDWFGTHGRALPWRTPAPRDPYDILVSEFMLQQTQVVTVIDYFQRWLMLFPSVAALASASEAEVLHAWQGLGYYSRARNLYAAAWKIATEHGGIFPRNIEQIRELPGVGPYTAAAVATFAFDQPVPPVDGNFIRVIARLLNFSKPVDTAAGLKRIRAAATRWQPETGAGLFNEALMELGALVCTPRNPRCPVCPLRAYCSAGEPESIPVKKPRPRTVELDECCGWIVRNGAVLLEQQTGKRWRGLWRLPLSTESHAGIPLVKLKYPFTHHRVTLSVFPATCPLFLEENQRWVACGELHSLAMPAPHRRALNKLLALNLT